jgi:hypothetical protein
MKPPLKRFGTLLTAAFSVVAIWSLGSLWIGTQPQAFAVAAGGDPIIPISGSGGSYLLSYYDVATAFLPSSGGYGGSAHSGGTGDALLRIVDAGNLISAQGVTDICANIYVFNDQQEMQECCSCPLTANSLITISVINDLISHPANPSESMSAGVIKIVGSAGSLCSNAPGAVSAATFTTVAEGLHAWINHTETMFMNLPPYPITTSTSVEEFAHSALDSGELAYLQGDCAFLNGFGRISEHPGVCSCGAGD